MTGRKKNALKLRRYRERMAASEEPRTKRTGLKFQSWAKKHLKVPTGKLAGRPFTVQDWQWDWIKAASAPGIREAGLSIARKNGKTGLIAAYLLYQLIHGPENWRCVVTSLSGNLAKELLESAKQTAVASEIDCLDWYATPPPGRIVGPEGRTVQMLAADKSTGHGISVDLAVIDEAGLLTENHRPLWNAMLSSVSARDGRLWAISIRGDSSMFSELAERESEKQVHWVEFAADPKASLDDEEGWLAANPGLGSIKSMTYMRDASNRALKTPADASAFRAYDLNQSLDPSREWVCSPDEWALCETAELPKRQGPCFVGLDLGGSTSMTALVAYWPDSKRMESWAAFPTQPDLLQRGQADRVGNRYQLMHDRKELFLMGNKVTDVAGFLDTCLSILPPIAAIGCDRYRKAETEQVFESVKFPSGSRVFWRGTGAAARADGSHDIRAFQRRVLNREIAHSPSLVAANAIAGSAIRTDPAGNPALDKQKSRSRIDWLQAAIIACGLADIRPAEAAHRYRMV